MKTIILINGLPRSGKDTVADYICQKYAIEKKSFADSLKNIICGTFNIAREELDVMKNAPYRFPMYFGEHKTDFRELLQRFGTEGMKPVFGASVWADILYDSVKKDTNYTTVVPDFRFLSEYKPQDDIRLHTVLIKDGRELPKEGHASDVELYKNDFVFDTIIENTGSIQDLYKKIDKELSWI